MDCNTPRRRPALSLSVLAMASVVAAAQAADPVEVGVLIPGSKSDKGWMESGYTGLVQAEKEFGGKIRVQISAPARSIACWVKTARANPRCATWC